MVHSLMIDDNPLDHLIMQKMFDKFHLFPDAAHSFDARTSMDFFERNFLIADELPDVVFLDLNMPGFNGWDFLESFELIYKRIKKPIDIYILSSSIDPSDKLLPGKYSFVKACLCKPAKAETLLNLYSLYQPPERFAC